MQFTLNRFASKLAFLCRVLGLLALLVSASHAAPVSLQRYNVTKSETSVSGLSAGGYMAVQMHVAHSAIMKGGGIFAAGPYQCAEGNLDNALHRCMEKGNGWYLSSSWPWTLSWFTYISALTSDDIARFAQRTRYLASKGLIDDPANLSRQKVWAFVGSQDRKVVPDVVRTLSSYYGNFMPQENIVFDDTVATSHNP